MRVATDTVISLPSTESAILKELSCELTTVHSKFQKSFDSIRKTLKETEKFFTAATTLKRELDVAIKQPDHSKQSLNPVVVEKLYIVLCAQAKQVNASLQAHKTNDIKVTLDSINEHLNEVEKVMNNYYLLGRSTDTEDLRGIFSLLDNLLLEIEKDVQDAIDSATGKEKKIVEKTPVKKSSKLSKTDDHKFEKVSASPRRGTVSNLKKLFELDTKLPDPPKSTSSPSVANWSASTYPPRRKLSSSSSIIEVPPSPIPLTPQRPNHSQSPVQSPIANTVVVVKTKDHSTTPVTSETTPIKPTTQTSSQADTVVVVKSKKAAVHSTITVNIQSVTLTAVPPPIPPPIPPLPITDELPNRPPPPLSESETDSSLPSTPPPITPSLSHSQSNSQELLNHSLEYSTSFDFEGNEEPSYHRSSQSPHEPQNLYCSSEESSHEVTSSEHTPKPNTLEQDYLTNEEKQTPHFSQEYAHQENSVPYLADSNYEEDEYLGNTSSDVYKNSENGYFYNRVEDLKMEGSIPHRDLSPVIEEMDDDELLAPDHPDIGWKKTSKEKTDKNLEWSRAHKQSLISMK